MGVAKRRKRRRARARASKRRQQGVLQTTVSLLAEGLETRCLLAGFWIPEGPGPSDNGQVENVSSDDFVVGAVHTALAHRTNPDILYVGGTNGGV
ncbi:MAG: hypothetical protein O3A00_10915 [Planctomycetota bacterium]|nr:hypothetical protein [Planctomycetota bacterium]